MEQQTIDQIIHEKIMDQDPNETDVPNYSGCLEPAWNVLKKMHAFMIEGADGKYRAVLTAIANASPSDVKDAEASTASLAICLAALKTKGVETTPWEVQ